MKLKSPNGKEIVGTYEVLYGTALLQGDEAEVVNGELEFEYGGETKVEWDSQKTLREKFTHTLREDQITESNKGQRLFVDEDGSIWTEAQVIESSK